MKPEILINSISGEGTNITLPMLKLGFDIGTCPDYAVRASHIMITHGHIDHLGAIVTHAARRDLIGMEPPTYIMPLHLIDPVKRIFEEFGKMNGATPYKIVELDFPETYFLGKKQNYYIIKPFPAHHRIPCQGYGIWTSKRVGGTSVPSTLMYAYTGDTTIDVLYSEAVRTARTLFIEATYICDKVPPEKAHQRGHIHLDDIVENADKFENERIVLMHFSARYNSQQIKDWLQKKLPSSIKQRTFVCLGGKPWKVDG